MQARIPVTQKTLILNTHDVSLALSNCLSDLGLSPAVTLLRNPEAADGASVFVVGKPRRQAALLISPIGYPNVVSEGQARAQSMRDYLGPELGSIVLTPLADGRIEGRSYVLLPFGRPLADNRLLWVLEKPRVKRNLLRWLQAVAQLSVEAPVERAYFANLFEQLCSLPKIEPETRKIALASIDRLSDHSFRPRFMPMHNDLWKGNVLLPSTPQMRSASAFDFFLIDWRGSRIEGFPFFDLVRLSLSLNSSSNELRREIEAMCKTVECELSDVKFYIAAALGELSTRLDHFPLANFLRMASACISELKGAALT